jgi:hypothetical protein
MTLKQIREAHPMPWRQTMIGNLVKVMDAKGEEVPMFTMLDLVSIVTAKLAGLPAE